MVEYLIDRLNHRIQELEARVERQKMEINAYKEMDKNRGSGEAAIFVVGALVGITIGYYAAMLR